MFEIPNYTLSRKRFLQAFPDDPRSEDVPVRSAPRGCRSFLESLDGSSTCSCVISEINERTEHAYTEIRPREPSSKSHPHISAHMPMKCCSRCTQGRVNARSTRCSQTTQWP